LIRKGKSAKAVHRWRRAAIISVRGVSPQRGFIPVIFGATESPSNHALDVELAVAGAIEGLGFSTDIIEVAIDLASIEFLASRRPLIVFNLVDALNCDDRLAALVPARLDALGIGYTGCGTSAFFETLSKVAIKLKLAHAGLPTPEWSMDGMGLSRDARVIVKALWAHGSLGLDETSVIHCADAPRVVAARSLRLNTEHFAEAFIEGREFNLALLQRTSGVEVLPIGEVLFGDAQVPKIVGYDAKWTPDSAVYIGIGKCRFGVEKDEPELATTLKQLALASWTLFGFTGYASVDFRVDLTGAPLIIDVNPNPFLRPDAEFATAAAEAGLSFRDLIGSIIEGSLEASKASLRNWSR
jgi:D-alanine-D-alanine ligase